MSSFDQRVLRVDLTTGTVKEEEVPREKVRKFIGGRPLGAMILYEEVNQDTKPLDPENKLIFSTGPLQGTNAPGSVRYFITTKSPQTCLYLCANSGGYFGPELKKTGHGMLIIEGRAEKPVYLVISNDSVAIKDATQFWGMTTDSTQEFIKGVLGDEKFRIACIGPAGENLVNYSCIVNERRVIGRGGAGAVMGSKNLKAVAVRGTQEIKVANSDIFKQSVKQALRDIKSSHRHRLVVPKYGSGGHMFDLNKYGIIPFRNWQEAGSPHVSDIAPHTWRDKFVIKDIRCASPCPVRCSKLTLVKEGPHAGALSEGPEYETLYSFGACCDITDVAAIIEADALCDKYGLDTISMGVSLAFATECYEKGIITTEDTDGIELKFGETDYLPKLIYDAAYRQGFGETLSLGCQRMAEKFGHGSGAFAMQVKGMELGGYDPRGCRSQALVFACGPRGGCHHAGGYVAYAEMANPGNIFSDTLKAAITKYARDRRVINDTTIICGLNAYISNETLVEMISTATGYDFTSDEIITLGDMCSNIERAFNVKEGLRRSWDTLPDRLLKEALPTGPSRGQVVNLEPMLDEFYALCGWDVKTGIPTQQKLIELGLPDIADDMRLLQE